jgi:hypothetical protein
MIEKDMTEITSVNITLNVDEIILLYEAMRIYDLGSLKKKNQKLC